MERSTRIQDIKDLFTDYTGIENPNTDIARQYIFDTNKSGGQDMDRFVVRAYSIRGGTREFWGVVEEFLFRQINRKKAKKGKTDSENKTKNRKYFEHQRFLYKSFTNEVDQVAIVLDTLRYIVKDRTYVSKRHEDWIYKILRPRHTHVDIAIDTFKKISVSKGVKACYAPAVRKYGLLEMVFHTTEGYMTLREISLIVSGCQLDFKGRLLYCNLHDKPDEYKSGEELNIDSKMDGIISLALLKL